MSYLHIRSIYTRYPRPIYDVHAFDIYTVNQPEITSVSILSVPTTAKMHRDTFTYTYARHLVCGLLPTHFHNLSHSNFIILCYLYDMFPIISYKLPVWNWLNYYTNEWTEAMKRLRNHTLNISMSFIFSAKKKFTPITWAFHFYPLLSFIISITWPSFYASLLRL